MTYFEFRRSSTPVAKAGAEEVIELGDRLELFHGLLDLVRDAHELNGVAVKNDKARYAEIRLA